MHFEAKVLLSIIVCPNCNAENAASNAQLRQVDLDLKVKCSTCCTRPPSRDWRCICMHRWHSCTKHHVMSNDNWAKGKPSSFSRRFPKRKLHSAPVGQVLDDDLQRESKLAKHLVEPDVITLESDTFSIGALRPNLIPQRLKDRFPQAFHSSCH